MTRSVAFVVIDRNIEAEKLFLNRRNVRRNRHASEADAMPNEENRFQRRRRRRSSFDSALVRKRRNSISIQQNPTRDSPNVSMNPFDDEFVQHLNRIVDSSYYNLS